MDFWKNKNDDLKDTLKSQKNLCSLPAQKWIGLFLAWIAWI
jgi:hypothetical protein